MARHHWLIKSEPNTYSWDDLVKLGKDHWDGVRNYQARNNMKAMKTSHNEINSIKIMGRWIMPCIELCSILKIFYN